MRLLYETFGRLKACSVLTKIHAKTMPRRKFRNSQRFESSTERSFQEYISEPTRAANYAHRTFSADSRRRRHISRTKSKAFQSRKNRAGNRRAGQYGGRHDDFRRHRPACASKASVNPEAVQEELVRICREEIFPPLVPLIDVDCF